MRGKLKLVAVVASVSAVLGLAVLWLKDGTGAVINCEGDPSTEELFLKVKEACNLQ